MNKDYEQHLDKFMEAFRQSVKEDADAKKELERQLQSCRAQNKHLIKKLGIKYDHPEITENESYLVDKIERLEDELRIFKNGDNWLNPDSVNV